MKVKLICSKTYQLLLKDFLEARNFQVSEPADLFLVENGKEIPTDGISIVFNKAVLNIIFITEIMAFSIAYFSNRKYQNFNQSLKSKKENLKRRD